MTCTMLQATLLLFAIFHISHCEDLSDLGDHWTCSRPGLNAHPHECHNFVLCLATQEGLRAESVFTCPDNFAFSSADSTCVHQDKVPGCTQNRHGTGDEDDGFSKRGPGMSSCKQTGAFCHNANVLVVCTDTRVPVLVLDCKSLGDTPLCDPLSATCSAEHLPPSPAISMEQDNEAQANEPAPEIEVEPPVQQNMGTLSNISATLANIIERIMSAFNRRFSHRGIIKDPSFLESQD